MSSLLFYQLIIIQLITFGVLIFILKIVFSKHVNKAVDRLKNLQSDNEAQAEKLAKEFEKFKKERELEIQKVRDDAKLIIEEARQKGDIIYQDSKIRAEKEYQVKLEESRKMLEKVKQELIAKFREQTINNSIQIIKYLFIDKGKESFQHHLIMDLVEEIKNIPKTKFLDRTDNIIVHSPFSLQEDEKKQLIIVLSEKMGIEVKIEEIVDRELLGGIIIFIKAMVIDGSIKKRIEKIKAHLDKDLKLNFVV